LTEHEKHWFAVSLVLFILSLGIYFAFCETGYAVESTHTIYPFQSTPDITANKPTGSKSGSFVTTNPIAPPGTVSATPGATYLTFEAKPAFSGVPSHVFNPSFAVDWLDGAGHVRGSDTSITAVIYFMQVFRKMHYKSPQPYGLMADTWDYTFGTDSALKMNPATGSSAHGFHRDYPTSGYYFRRGSYDVFNTAHDANPPDDSPTDERVDFDHVTVVCVKYERNNSNGWDGEYKLATDWRSVGERAGKYSGVVDSVNSSELAPAVAMSGMAQMYPYYISIGECNPADNVVAGTFASVGQTDLPYSFGQSVHAVGGSFVSTAYAQEVFDRVSVETTLPVTTSIVPEDPKGDLEKLGLGDADNIARGYANDAVRPWSWLSPWEWFLGEAFFE